MQIYSIDGVTPVIDPSAYVHPTAVLIGDAIVGPNCYVGPNAVMRGDFGRLILEAGSNLQDTCVMHGFPGSDTVLAENAHIGHGAVLHGCIIGRNALVGMNTVIMDGAIIGEESIIGACAFVKAKFECPARSMVVGSPAKIIRQVSDQELAWKSQGTREYQQLAQRSHKTMTLTTALTQVEADRKRIDIDSVKPLYETKAQQ